MPRQRNKKVAFKTNKKINYNKSFKQTNIPNTISPANKVIKFFWRDHRFYDVASQTTMNSRLIANQPSHPVDSYWTGETDPNTSVAGWKETALLYKKHVCIGSKIVHTITNPESNTVPVKVWFYKYRSGESTIADDQLEQFGVRYKIIKPGQTKKVRLSFSFRKDVDFQNRLNAAQECGMDPDEAGSAGIPESRVFYFCKVQPLSYGESPTVYVPNLDIRTSVSYLCQMRDPYFMIQHTTSGNNWFASTPGSAYATRTERNKNIGDSSYINFRRKYRSPHTMGYRAKSALGYLARAAAAAALRKTEL